MIHISQEELFRKIEQEHKFDQHINLDEEQQQQQQQESSSVVAAAAAAVATTTGPARDNKSSFSIKRSNSRSQRQAGPQQQRQDTCSNRISSTAQATSGASTNRATPKLARGHSLGGFSYKAAAAAAAAAVASDSADMRDSLRRLRLDNSTNRNNNNLDLSSASSSRTATKLQASNNNNNNNNSKQEMLSILPKTSYDNLHLRDTNNNNSSNHNVELKDDDEVQAVLITGCGSKIGSNIAVAFAARGLKVALVDFDIQQTETVARECQDKSPKNRVPLQIVADISQLAEAHKVIDRTIEAFGRLDVLVNTVNNASLMEAKFNSGSGDDDPHVFEQYHKIIANNMHSVTYLCISAAPYLRKSKGSIVNVSSITNNETGSYKFAYCMSKAGISTLTKCLATDLAPDIKVICVSPKSDA